MCIRDRILTLATDSETLVVVNRSSGNNAALSESLQLGVRTFASSKSVSDIRDTSSNRQQRSTEMRERLAANGYSASASSATFWKRRLGSFSRQRATTASSAAGMPELP